MEYVADQEVKVLFSKKEDYIFRNKTKNGVYDEFGIIKENYFYEFALERKGRVIDFYRSMSRMVLRVKKKDIYKEKMVPNDTEQEHSGWILSLIPLGTGVLLIGARLRITGHRI